MDGSPILADFMQLCTASVAPEPWSRLMKSNDFRRMPRDRRSALAELRSKHSDDDLVQTGVVVRDDAEELDFNSVFCAVPDSIVALRTKPEAAPFDLLTSQGTVSGILPVSAAARDRLAEKGELDRGFVIAAFSIDDVLALRAIGAPTACAASLERFSSQAFSEFRETFMMPTTDGDGRPPQLILTAWSPARLDRIRTAAVDPAVRNILHAANAFGLRLDDVLFWEPTASEIKKLAHCLRIGNRADAACAILNSLERSTTPLSSMQTERTPFEKVLKAEADLRQDLLRSTFNLRRRQKYLRRYEKAIDEAFAKPVLALAAEETHAKEKSRLMALAAAIRILHPAALEQAVSMQKNIAQGGSCNEMQLRKIRDLTAMFETVHKLTKVSK
jgi:hypothetical protein